MSDQPNEAAKALTELCDELEMVSAVCTSADYIQLILAAIRDGKVPGIVEAKSLPLIRDEMTAMQAEITSLRSALANAEKSLTAARDDLLREGMERDAALAKLAEAEAQRDVQTSECRTAHDLYQAVRDERNKLAVQLAEARWIPCSERYPADDTEEVLFYSTVLPGIEVGHFINNNWEDSYRMTNWDKGEVTHWRPLPAPPSDRDEGEKS